MELLTAPLILKIFQLYKNASFSCLQLLQSQERRNNGSDDEADEYFSDIDDTNSINNAPSGLMSLLGRSSLR